MMDAGNYAAASEYFDKFFERTFRWINPKQFEKCFIHCIREIAALADRSIVAMDGKSMCGDFDTDDKKSPIHIVSAWVSENR